MLDIRWIRQNPQALVEAMKRRGMEVDVDAFLFIDEERRKNLGKVEALKARRNEVSSAIPRMKKHGDDVSALMDEMKQVGQRVKQLDEDIAKLDEQIAQWLLSVPNCANPKVPLGATEADNEEIRRWGDVRAFAFEPKAHWDIGEALGILDFSAAARITGARFTVYRGQGAKLERALINYMLDLHAQRGYDEVLPPYMVHRNSMIGTGQLPKFEDDAFKVANTEYFLIPTAEVPVTNLYRDQILDAALLPIKHCAYSACFRAEAGSAGRDTRGLIRQHQFNKVELVKFTTPESSYDELESLLSDAERVLQGLGLPYRVVRLCAGDLGFASAMTYDLEVFMPSYNRYVEISSCSNYEDYQARRANIKYRPSAKDKPAFLHTLNGSGVAVGRTLACVLETYQRADGKVDVPDVLKPFMGVSVIG